MANQICFAIQSIYDEWDSIMEHSDWEDLMCNAIELECLLKMVKEAEAALASPPNDSYKVL